MPAKNSTNYQHPDEPNLLNIHKAMDYSSTGQPVLRASMEGVTITAGSVNVDAVKIWDGTHYVTLDEPSNDNESSTGIWAFSTENYNMVFNGSTWDRMRGNINDGVLVKVSNPVTSVSATVTGTIALDSATLSALETINVNATQTGTWTVGLSQASLDALETTTVNQGTAGSSAWKVDIGNNGQIQLLAGSAIIGKVSLVDSSGNNNDANHPVYVAGSVTVNPSNTTNTLVKFGDDTNLQLDATERLRVSQSWDSWWYAPTIDKDTDLRYIESYTGTNAGSLFIQNLSSISMSPGTDNGGTFTRISRRRHKMRPATSIRVAMNANFNGYDANVRKRVGLFTNYNGVFYEVNSDLSLHIRRRLADGTMLEKVINRADFNQDPLDGSVSLYDFRPNSPHNFDVSVTGYVSTSTVVVGGTTIYNVTLTVSDRSKLFAGIKGRITGITPSTFNQVVMVESVSGGDNASGAGNITVTMLSDPGVFASVSSAVFSHSYLFHQHVLGFDFNGNRMNKIRFFINGLHGQVAIHVENFDDTLSTPWSNAPAMSTRYEITNLAAPGYRPSLLSSSETVNIEGPTTENPAFGTAYNNTYINYIKTQTQEFPVIGIALRASEPYQRVDLQVRSFQVTDIANINPQNSGVFFWRLLLNPTIGGTVPASTNVGKATRTWAYTAATTVSGGIELTSGYTTQGTIIDVPTGEDFVNLGSNIDYTDSDTLVLVVKQLAGGSADAHIVAQMNFVEYL